MVDPKRELSVIERFAKKCGENVNIIAGPSELTGTGARDGLIEFAGEQRYVEIFSVYAQRDIRKHMAHAQRIDDQLQRQASKYAVNGLVTIHLYGQPLPDFSDTQIEQILRIVERHGPEDNRVHTYDVGGTAIGVNKMPFDHPKVSLTIESGNDVDQQLPNQISEKNRKVAKEPGSVLLIDMADIQMISIFDIGRTWLAGLPSVEHGNFHSIWVVDQFCVAPLKTPEWIYSDTHEDFLYFKSCVLGNPNKAIQKGRPDGRL
jgi:hypothetical protein